MFKTSTFLIIFWWLASSAPAGAAPPNWGALKPGPYAVGYRGGYERDPSRIFFTQTDFRGRRLPGDRRRPVPLRLWYPAAAGAGKAFQYEGYLALPVTEARMRDVERGYEYRNRSVHQFALRTYAPGADESVLRAMYASSVAARADARPARGRFPIIVFGGGANHSVDENVVLWEYLASHGFVVAVVPAQAQSSTSFAPDAPGLEALARDMEFALSRARELPFADPDRVGVMGFSYGGAAALLIAMRNVDVDAVVGWDSSITSERFNKGLLASPHYDPGRVRAPLLEIRHQDLDAAPPADNQIIEALRHSDRRTFAVQGADHIDFNSYSMALRPVATGFEPERGRSFNERKELYEAMARKTAAFLKATLQGDAQAEGSLDEPLVGSQVSFSSVVRRKAEPALPTPDDLAQLIKTDGLKRTLPLFPRLGDNAEDRVRSLIIISETGQALIESGRIADAIQAHRINVRRYPEYLGPLVSLGAAFRRGDDKQCASATYRAIIAYVAAKADAVTALDMERRNEAQKDLAQLGSRFQSGTGADS